MVSSALSIGSISPKSKLSRISSLSIKFPGSIAFTIEIPIIRAIEVVITK